MRLRAARFRLRLRSFLSANMYASNDGHVPSPWIAGITPSAQERDDVEFVPVCLPRLVAVSGSLSEVVQAVGVTQGHDVQDRIPQTEHLTRWKIEVAVKQVLFRDRLSVAFRWRRIEEAPTKASSYIPPSCLLADFWLFVQHIAKYWLCCDGASRWLAVVYCHGGCSTPSPMPDDGRRSMRGHSWR